MQDDERLLALHRHGVSVGRWILPDIDVHGKVEAQNGLGLHQAVVHLNMKKPIDGQSLQLQAATLSGRRASTELFRVSVAGCAGGRESMRMCCVLEAAVREEGQTSRSCDDGDGLTEHMSTSFRGG